MSTILALDIGLARTGIAVSDPEQSWAFGRGVVEGDFDAIIEAIGPIIKDEEVGQIVIGLPIPLTKESDQDDQAASVRAIAEQIGQKTGLPIIFEEERFTTLLGQRLEHDAGRKKGDDERSAILILESYLIRSKNQT